MPGCTRAGIADACHDWLKVLSGPVLQPHNKLTEKHLKQAVLDEHLVAYTPHSLYRSASLTRKQLAIVNECILTQVSTQ